MSETSNYELIFSKLEAAKREQSESSGFEIEEFDLVDESIQELINIQKDMMSNDFNITFTTT
ncbi:hypothetical protein FKX85_06675 [Echinicola soli]|uniref:Uncharacterized protein n=1 Tax=Echinicola soli TaxID=2591634 RepID=A0A514CFY3_9BACT|nr:hypothetical protein [Echinicola soli]QDH78736.1 hypothetical protein FKX85_06675 [Echinicola soli]